MTIKITWYTVHLTYMPEGTQYKIEKSACFTDFEEAKQAILNPVEQHRHEGNLKDYQIRYSPYHGYVCSHFMQGEFIRIDIDHKLGWEFAADLYRDSLADELYEPNHCGYWCKLMRDRSKTMKHGWMPRYKDGRLIKPSWL